MKLLKRVLLFFTLQFNAQESRIKEGKIMKVSQITIIGFLFCLVNACGFQGYMTPFETTVLVTDMNDKPLSGRKVKLFIGLGTAFSNKGEGIQSAITNTEGKVVFKYNLSVSESTQDYATLTVEGDSLWHSVNYEQHSIGKNSKKIKRNTTLQMDTLTVGKLRLRKVSATPLNLGFTVSGSLSTDFEKKMNNAFFYGWRRDSIGLLDTIFTFKAYSNSPLDITASTVKITNTFGGGFTVQGIEQKKIEVILAKNPNTILDIELK